MITLPPITRVPGLPLHQQVSRALRDYVRDALRPNDPIPTEPELEARFGVSRATVRRAVDDLVDEGLLARRQGAGTFVLSPKLTYEPAKLTSWSETIRALGEEPRTRRLQLREIPAPAWIGDRLNLPPGAPVVWLWRLRCAGEQPISVMVNYLVAARVPGLATRGLRHESLYDELRQVYQLPPVRTDDEVEAQLATDDEAALLEIAPGSPILEVKRTTFIADGSPLEVSVARSRADRYRYRASAVDWTAPGGPLAAAARAAS